MSFASHLEKLFFYLSFRDIPQSCSGKKGVPKCFAKFARKHLCQSLLFNEVAVKKETLTQIFSCKFCEILMNMYFGEHLWTTASEVLKIEILNLQVCPLVVPLANLLLYTVFQLIKIKLTQSRNNEHFVKLMVECQVLRIRGV